MKWGERSLLSRKNRYPETSQNPLKKLQKQPETADFSFCIPDNNNPKMSPFHGRKKSQFHKFLITIFLYNETAQQIQYTGGF